MSDLPLPARRSRRRQVAIAAIWAAVLVFAFVAVEVVSGDIHFGKKGPPADHSAYVASGAHAASCQAEPFTLREKTEPFAQRLIYSCVDIEHRWACFIEQGEIVNVTQIVRVVFAGQPRRSRPRCTRSG